MQVLVILLLAWVAGLAAAFGGLLARFENSPDSEAKDGFNRAVVAFGGGILIAAIAFALAPEGMRYLHPAWLACVFAAGGVMFCAIDVKLSRTGGSRAQLLAMMMDFVPEAISLGAVFAHNHQLGMTLALFIAAQNVPEGFNAYRELIQAGKRQGQALLLLLFLSVFGPLSAGTGYLFLQDRETITASIMCFAAGGILYLLFHDIAPASVRTGHWKAPIGAVLGFVVGMVGTLLINP
jgi:zinc transporter, ZIP family